jgi:hypothetical protein
MFGNGDVDDDVPLVAVVFVEVEVTTGGGVVGGFRSARATDATAKVTRNAPEARATLRKSRLEDGLGRFFSASLALMLSGFRFSSSIVGTGTDLHCLPH